MDESTDPEGWIFEKYPYVKVGFLDQYAPEHRRDNLRFDNCLYIIGVELTVKKGGCERLTSSAVCIQASLSDLTEAKSPVWDVESP